MSQTAIRALDLCTFKSGSRGAKAVSEPARICVTSDIRDFASFWPRSISLGAAHSYPFQCAELIELRCKTFVPALKVEPCLIAILNVNDQPLVLFPLCIETRRYSTGLARNLRVLRFLRGGLCDYNAPVLFPPAAKWDKATVRKVWRGLGKLLPPFDIALLEGMPDHVEGLPNPFCLLGSELRGAGQILTTWHDSSAGHSVNLAGTWESYAKRFPRHSELDRRARRLNEIGQLRMDLAKTPAEYDLFLESLIRQKRRRDLEAHGRDSLRVKGYIDYFKGARDHLYPSGAVCLFALKVNETIIATHFGVATRYRFIGLTPGFEAGQWYKFSPGSLLNYKIIEWCYGEGISAFDLGVGNEKYKDEFCDITMPLYKRVTASTARGAIFLHTQKTFERFHQKRVDSWREMELAESAFSNPAEISKALAHARKSWTLWPSPRRTREFFKVAKRIRSMKSGNTI